MSNPREGQHETRVVDGRTFDVWPLIWPDKRESWEVLDVASDTLLTINESLDARPDDDDVRALVEDLEPDRSIAGLELAYQSALARAKSAESEVARLRRVLSQLGNDARDALRKTGR